MAVGSEQTKKNSVISQVWNALLGKNPDIVTT